MWLTAGNPPQPVHRSSAVESQPLVFPHGPSHQDAIQHMEDSGKGRSVVLSIVVYPSSKDWITDVGQLFQAHVAPQVNPPVPHLSAYLFGCLITDRRNEADKVSAVSRLAEARAKGKAQKIKSLVRVGTWPPIILAVNNLGLLRMKLQPALQKPPFDHRSDPFGLSLTSAMHDDVIGIAFKRNARIAPPHPLVERIVQKEIGQQWTNHSTSS